MRIGGQPPMGGVRMGAPPPPSYNQALAHSVQQPHRFVLFLLLLESVDVKKLGGGLNFFHAEFG